MNVVFDNNVIIDALEPRPPFDIAAKELLLRVLREEIKGLITANSLTDIFFILSRKAGALGAREAIQNLIELLEVISITGSDCKDALALPIADFEDALIATCSKKAEADYIVTRDDLFLRQSSPIPLISPGELLEKLK